MTNSQQNSSEVIFTAEYDRRAAAFRVSVNEPAKGSHDNRDNIDEKRRSPEALTIVIS